MGSPLFTSYSYCSEKAEATYSPNMEGLNSWCSQESQWLCWARHAARHTRRYSGSSEANHEVQRLEWLDWRGCEADKMRLELLMIEANLKSKCLDFVFSVCSMSHTIINTIPPGPKRKAVYNHLLYLCGRSQLHLVSSKVANCWWSEWSPVSKPMSGWTIHYQLSSTRG